MFWEAYPRKVGKGGASLAWKRADPSLAAVLAALDWQRNSEDWTRDGGTYVPHPATYLNQRRWEDEPRRQTNGVTHRSDKTERTVAALTAFVGGGQ